MASIMRASELVLAVPWLCLLLAIRAFLPLHISPVTTLFLVSGVIDGTISQARQAGARDAEDVRDCPVRLAAFTPEAAATSRSLKQFLYKKVYDSRALGKSN